MLVAARNSAIIASLFTSLDDSLMATCLYPASKYRKVIDQVARTARFVFVVNHSYSIRDHIAVVEARQMSQCIHLVV